MNTQQTLGDATMRKLSLLVTILASAITVLAAVPAQAQSTRTWVSPTGTDTNTCGRTDPCGSFTGAFSKTATGGIINCLDPGGFGTLIINKSIEINCLNTHGGMLASGTNGIVINTAGITVVLRGMSIEGNGSTPGVVGIAITEGATVHVERLTIRNFKAGAASGIRITNTSGIARVNISNSDITENGTGSAGAGILSIPTGGGFSLVQVSNTNINGNTFGVANTANSRMRLSRAIIAGNATGVQSDPGGLVSLNDNDISFNNTAITGATFSFGNNRITGSLTSDGTAPSPAGAASSDLGLR